MDKSWMMRNRLSKEYELGVESFLEFGLRHANGACEIRCPCLKCGNRISKDASVIRTHLYVNGIDQSYKIWFWHGEDFALKKDNDRFGYDMNGQDEEDNDIFNAIDMIEVAHDESSHKPKMFDNMFEDARKPLYPGCKKFTKLSVIVRLYNLKVRFGWSSSSFSELLSTLREILPEDNLMPESMYEAKKTLVSLGLSYEKIDACPNDCCLYRKEYATMTKCPHCDLSRWKQCRNSTEVKKGVAAKQMWYFPIIPRFLRLFRNSDHAKKLCWHATDRKIDDYMRHPADSPSWRLIDHLWPEFGSESRNLRLGLSTDGVNPFGDLSSKYSCWPVITTIYNLPPWLCMRRKFLMLTMLISGPKQPGYDISIYLAPLIEDLKFLWVEGVQCFDAHKNETFTLKAVLLWTINDFPAYGNLSGCSVKGYKACPICGEDTSSIWLKFGRKNVYMGHRKYLERHHPYRRERKAFNGNQEDGTPPVPLTGEAIHMKLKGMKFPRGKKCCKKLKKQIDDSYWKRRSEFFELPYWEKLHVRHCIDVMHIEKNVCMNIIGTLLDMPGKSKDGVETREDLADLQIRPELHKVEKGNRTFIPAACYTLTREEKHRFCTTLARIKVPEGYSSNIRSLVSLGDLKLIGLKSHDCHVLMQQLLPVAMRSVLPKTVRYAITRLCLFFNAICCKIVKVSELNKLQNDIAVTLCLLEKYFPPSFFTIMMHLTVHIVREVKLCGPIYLRWMYPFERYMKVLKSYVGNRTRPEGSMAEAYIVEEAVEFCSEFFDGLDAAGLGSFRLLEERIIDRPLSVGSYTTPCFQQLRQAHLHILENLDEMQPYRSEHMELLKKEHPRRARNEKWLQTTHNKTFIKWISKKVMTDIELGCNVSKVVRWVAHGPHPKVITYEGYKVNGCTYNTKTRDNHRSNQNSGVVLVAMTMQVSSAKDKNPIVSDMCFYGVIKEIWELSYNTFKIPIFKCDWVENHTGVRVDELGFTLVNHSHIGQSTDSFIIASKVKQVFYIEDPEDALWSVVITPPQRDYAHNFFDDDVGDTCLDVPSTSENIPTGDVGASETSYTRNDCEGLWI